MAKASRLSIQVTSLGFMERLRQNSFPAIYKGTARYTDKISGEFTRPTGVAGKVPVMVIMHSSGGVSDAGTGAWSKYFLKMGIATFVVDSFNPRVLKSTAADQSVLTDAGSVADALKALEAVAAIPDVDVNRIGVIGFSRGGNAALGSSYSKVKTGVLGENSPLKFALHVGFYSGCVRTGTTDGTPLLVFEGGRDDYHSLKSCNTFADSLKAKGANLTYVTYPEATHGFDIDRKSVFAAKAQVWGACPRERLEDLDTLAVTIDGIKVPMREYIAYSKECMTHGVNLEYNRVAAEDAKQRVEQFVRKYFAM